VSVRVAAVVVKDGRVLLARHEKGGESYWVLPGGAVEHGETLAEALQRELHEEAGLAVEPGDVLFVNDGYRPEAETVAVYFSATLTGQTVGGTGTRGASAREPRTGAPLERGTRATQGAGEVGGETPGQVLREVRWVPIDEAGRLDLRPNIRSELMEYLKTGRVRSRYLGRR
jgi:ADP-ribose pyrophosphatase YjhB (NUDIX family)